MLETCHIVLFVPSPLHDIIIQFVVELKDSLVQHTCGAISSVRAHHLAAVLFDRYTYLRIHSNVHTYYFTLARLHSCAGISYQSVVHMTPVSHMVLLPHVKLYSKLLILYVQRILQCLMS